MTIKPTLILWAYDDEELNDGNVSEPPDSLRCLAAASLGPNDVYSPLSTPLDAFYFTRIVTQVREHEGDNKIRAWIASQRPPKYGVTDYTKYDPETNNFLYSYDIAHTLELGKILDDIRNGFKVSEGALWPVLDFSDGVEQNLMTDRFTLIGWDYVNPEFSRFETEKVDGRSNIKTTILTQFATGAAYNRAGIFQGTYTEDDDKNNIPSTYNLNFRNFAVGIPGTGDGTHTRRAAKRGSAVHRAGKPGYASLQDRARARRPKEPSYTDAPPNRTGCSYRPARRCVPST